MSAYRCSYGSKGLQRRRQHHGRRRACGDPKRLRREHKTTACCCRPKETGTHRTDTRTCVHCVGIHPVHGVEEVKFLQPVHQLVLLYRQAGCPVTAYPHWFLAVVEQQAHRLGIHRYHLRLGHKSL